MEGFQRSYLKIFLKMSQTTMMMMKFLTIDRWNRVNMCCSCLHLCSGCNKMFSTKYMEARMEFLLLVRECSEIIPIRDSWIKHTNIRFLTFNRDDGRLNRGRPRLNPVLNESGNHPPHSHSSPSHIFLIPALVLLPLPT